MKCHLQSQRLSAGHDGGIGKSQVLLEMKYTVLVLSGAEDSQDTDEILTRISGLDEAMSASISPKRSLQQTSFLRSDNAEKSKRTRVAHGKSAVVDIYHTSAYRKFRVST